MILLVFGFVCLLLQMFADSAADSTTGDAATPSPPLPADS